MTYVYHLFFNNRSFNKFELFEANGFVKCLFAIAKLSTYSGDIYLPF
jgi:hypothetical protein